MLPANNKQQQPPHTMPLFQEYKQTRHRVIAVLKDDNNCNQVTTTTRGLTSSDGRPHHKLRYLLAYTFNLTANCPDIFMRKLLECVRPDVQRNKDAL